jgi:hypothetical protein
MRVAVIGGGIFGCTAAIYAARAGHEVHLFEKQDGLLRGASGLNQFRLHRGYHYPRSPETIRECLDGLVAFRAEYASAVRDEPHYYALARSGSHLSPAEYLDALDAAGLPYTVTSGADRVNQDAVELVIKLDEPRYDPVTLRGLVWEKLRQVGVTLHLGGEPHVPQLRSWADQVVIACYANNNAVAEQLGCRQDTYQFEVCEKPVVRMPESFGRNTSIVVMDGEFCSVDPYGDTGLHVLGHVKVAVRSRNVGTRPEFGQEFHRPEYLDAGLIALDGYSANASCFPAFLDSGRFVPAVYEATHIGSMYTVRAVLSDKDETDERPTLVERLDDQVIRIFSGKVPSCVLAAQKTASILGTTDRPVQSAA